MSDLPEPADESSPRGPMGQPTPARPAGVCWDRLNPTIAELSQAIEREVEKCPPAHCSVTRPGVGPLTSEQKY